MCRAAAAFLILLLAAGTGRPCEAEDGKKVQAFRCEEDRSACVLLQMAVAGEFDHFDPGDALYLRVYSAVFLQLRDITADDEGVPGDYVKWLIQGERDDD